VATNILKPEQIALVAAEAGFNGENLITIVAISLAESGGNALAVGDAQLDPYRSYGLWQINSHAHPYMIGLPADPSRWYDPQVNAGFAYRLSGGKVFTPWSVFKNGRYLNKMDQARAGVKIYLDNPSSIAPIIVMKPSGEIENNFTSIGIGAVLSVGVEVGKDI
jgi:hypothetical protein